VPDSKLTFFLLQDKKTRTGAMKQLHKEITAIQPETPAENQNILYFVSLLTYLSLSEKTEL
jgi:hypothetical protein